MLPSGRSVLVYILITQNSKYRRGRNSASALQQGNEQELRGLSLISRYPHGLVVKVVVSHLNAKGSIHASAMIFLHGFHQCSSFSFLERAREREKGMINPINESKCKKNQALQLSKINFIKFVKEVFYINSLKKFAMIVLVQR
jgi:hypothetical protein